MPTTTNKPSKKPASKTYGKKADLALDLWIKLARSFSTFNRRTGESIASFGLTMPQFAVVECLGHLGELTIGELCEKNLVSGGNMTVVVDNLAKEGLVTRVRDTEDRRVVRAKLTLKGDKLFQKTFPPHAKYIADLASVLTASEQTELARLLRKLGLALKAE